MKTSEYKLEIDQQGEVEWSALLEEFADANIYQTWAYGAVRWGSRNLSHLVLKRGEKAVGLAQLRIIRPANLRMGVAYLRWGPMWDVRGEGANSGVLRELAKALRDEYCQKRGLYLEILPNAFLGTPRAEAFRDAFGEYECGHRLTEQSYRTLVLDLGPSLEELRKNLDRKWRNQLNAAERNNLSLLVGESAKEYGSFVELYNQMWKRKKFKTTVSVEEFGRIQESLPARQRMRVMVCMHEGKPAAGVVCSAMGNTGIYLLGATNETGLKSKAAYFLHWSLIQWLKEKGKRHYDLGGIDPEANPGVYRFKCGFSGADVTHMSPLTTCDNRLSLAMVKTGHMLRDGWRSLQTRNGES